MALSKTTQNHDEIKAWAEKRGGRPADVESTETANEAGILRLEFPDAPNANDANLKEIDWEPFFEKFDKSGLAMVYQEVTAEGAESNFYKFVHPENVAGSAKKSAKKTTAKKASTSTPKKMGAKTAPASKEKTAPAKKVAVKKAGGSKSALVKKTAPVKPASAKTSASKPAATKVAAKTASAKVPAKKAVAAKKAAKK